MAIDSAARRKAAAGASLPFIPTPPIPDGDISAADRAALAGVYPVHAATPFSKSSGMLWRTFRDRYHPLSKLRSRY